MKLSRLLLVVAMAAMSMPMLSAVAKADGLADPRIIVDGPGDPAVYDGAGPLDLTFSATGFDLGFIYQPDGSSPSDPSGPNLNSLVIDLSEVPVGDVFQCNSDIWVECSLGVIGVDQDGTLVYAISFDDLFPGTNTPGEGGPCQNNTPAGGTCPGFLAPEQTFDAALITPEPSTVLLLVGGLIPLVAFGRKRRKTVSAV
jgi:hypothetical protein